MSRARPRTFRIACAFAPVLLAGGCDHAGNAELRPVDAATSTVSSAPTTSAVPGNLLPDPRVTCRGDTQLAMNGCSYQTLQEAEAELRVAVAVMPDRTELGTDLAQLQTNWAADRDRLCDAMPKGGSAEPLFANGCRESFARHRSDELFGLDVHGNDRRPSDFWGKPFNPLKACVTRLEGSISGTPPLFGEVTLVDASSTLRLEFDRESYGLTMGTLDERATLARRNGSRVAVYGTSSLWGQRVVDTIAGVYQSNDVIDGEPQTSYGYWYLIIDGGAAHGEIINLANVDARSELTATITPCG